MGRDPKHDYKSRCIYHITIGKAPSCPVFSRISGPPTAPVIDRSPIGEIIESQINNFPNLCASFQILQHVIMPDHIHFAIFAREYLPRVLGRYIGMMKVRSGQLIRAEFPAITQIFTEDFHDRYLRPYHSLSAIIEYIRQNPHRLQARKFYPDFFRKINNITICGGQWQAYGNIQLLDNPFKAPVVIHRSDSEAILSDKKRLWRHLAENGGVLVSPFISQDEKTVRLHCEEADGKIILLTNRPFREREKPALHDFEQCSKGRLLILAPMDEMSAGRKTFLYLNSIAELIAPTGASRSIPT